MNTILRLSEVKKRNLLTGFSVRYVPISEAQAAVFSVSFGESSP
jgi:hypothetical protein